MRAQWLRECNSAVSGTLPGTGRSRMVSFPTVYQRVVVHWRAIVLLLILGFVAFIVAPFDEFVPFMLILFALLLLFIASQIFWIGRILDLGERFIPGKPRRVLLAIILGLVYLFVFAYNFPSIESTNTHVFRAADYRLHSVVLEAAYWWWFVGSLLAFLLVIAFGAAGRAARAAGWVYRKVRTAIHERSATADTETALLSPGRRRLLEQTAVLVSATPFVAAVYGLLYERQDVEIVRQRVRLARLPKAFEGFRIAQLSDIHISPFMPADEIRRCVTITNQLEADLVVLTGDYVSWDPAAQEEVVQALAGLRAPYGVFGCLGNHEVITETEDSITRLFAAQGIRILRQERAPIRRSEEALNLIGVDDSLVDLQAIQSLVTSKTVNILLVHNISYGFEAAVQFGFDLILTGHTHGGQLSLEFLRRGLALIRLETPYVSGWFEKAGGQLYVNRGIGTTILPIRLGARPEITELELVRGV